MEIKNPLKKDAASRSTVLKDRPRVEIPKEKRDYFEAGLIMGIGLMIGALITYLLITFELGI